VGREEIPSPLRAEGGRDMLVSLPQGKGGGGGGNAPSCFGWFLREERVSRAPTKEKEGGARSFLHVRKPEKKKKGREVSHAREREGRDLPPTSYGKEREKKGGGEKRRTYVLI